jgi:hypothetical protein
MPADFSERLSGVFSLILTPPDSLGLRRHYTTAEVAEVIQKRHEEGRDQRTLSKVRLNQLRNQRGHNPTSEVMRTIAGAFAELARQSMPADVQDDESAADAILWCLVSDHAITRTVATRATNAARALIGQPYRAGDTGPEAYDAAGLTHAAWHSVGVLLPTTPAAQADAGQPTPLPLAEPADLLFWSHNGKTSGIQHVAIYVGDGRVVEAHPDTGVHERAVTMPTDTTPAEPDLLGYTTRINRADTVLTQFLELSAARDRNTEMVGVMGRYLELRTPEARRAVLAFIDREHEREGLLGRLRPRRRRPRQTRPDQD